MRGLEVPTPKEVTLTCQGWLRAGPLFWVLRQPAPLGCRCWEVLGLQGRPCSGWW